MHSLQKRRLYQEEENGESLKINTNSKFSKIIKSDNQLWDTYYQKQFVKIYFFNLLEQCSHGELKYFPY